MAQLSGSLIVDDGTIKNRHVSNNSADIIAAQKVEHVYKAFTNFDLPIGGTPSAREEIVFVASGAGTILGFHAVCDDTGTSADVSFDLKKNGTTTLTGAINITNADSDGEVKDGTLSGTSFVADDIFSIALTTSSTTGMTGPFAWAEFEEDAPA